jgi:WD40 repeat protein
MIVLEGHIGAVNSASLSNDCKRLVSGSSDKTLMVWDLEQGIPIARFHCDEIIFTCRLLPDGQTILAMGFSEKLFLLKLEDSEGANMA